MPTCRADCLPSSARNLHQLNRPNQVDQKYLDEFTCCLCSNECDGLWCCLFLLDNHSRSGSRVRRLVQPVTRSWHPTNARRCILKIIRMIAIALCVAVFGRGCLMSRLSRTSSRLRQGRPRPQPLPRTVRSMERTGHSERHRNEES